MRPACFAQPLSPPSVLLLSLPLASSLARGTLDDAPVVGGTTVPPGAWPDVVAVLTRRRRPVHRHADRARPRAHRRSLHRRASRSRSSSARVDLAKPGGERREVKWSTRVSGLGDRRTTSACSCSSIRSPRSRARSRAAASTNETSRAATKLQVVGFGLTTQGRHRRQHAAASGEACRSSTPTCTHGPGVRSRRSRPDGEFIAGGHGIDACFGDSGGPVYITTTAGRR